MGGGGGGGGGGGRRWQNDDAFQINLFIEIIETIDKKLQKKSTSSLKKQ